MARAGSYFTLVFQKNGKTIRVIGTDCRTRREAETLWADRVANGDAFPGERVVRVRIQKVDA